MDEAKLAHLNRILENRRTRSQSSMRADSASQPSAPSGLVVSPNPTMNSAAAPTQRPPLGTIQQDAQPSSPAARPPPPAARPPPANAEPSRPLYSAATPAAPQSVAATSGPTGAPPPASGSAQSTPRQVPLAANAQFLSRVNQTLGRGGGTATVPSAVQQRAPSVASNASAQDGGLFQKGTFANFRQRPLLVSATVRPYRNEGSQSREVAEVVPAAAPRRSSVQLSQPAEVTEKNPFRTQGYEEFAIAPRYDVPGDVKGALEYHDVHNTEGSVRHALQEQENNRFDQNAAAVPVFDVYQCVRALEKGDWFLKWTRNRDKVHRRYFWLDVQRSVLFWAKTPDAFSYLSPSIRVEDMCSIEAQCVVDDASGKTLYLLVIQTTSRHVQMGTEVREKFDVWFDTLQRLSETVRDYNGKYYQRYAGAKYNGPTAMSANARTPPRQLVNSGD